MGRREQQFGPGVDRCSIFFFRPGQQWIVRPKTGLDVRNGNCSDKCGKSRPERARGIALNDEKVWWISQQGQHRSGNGPHVRMRIRLASAVQLHATEFYQSEILWIEVRVLTRKDQCRPEPPLCERSRNRRQFDRFRPGADHQPYVGKVQPSP